MTLCEGNRNVLGRLKQGYTGNNELLARIKSPTLSLRGSSDRLVRLSQANDPTRLLVPNRKSSRSARCNWCDTWPVDLAALTKLLAELSFAHSPS
jgi:hypothetical protein